KARWAGGTAAALLFALHPLRVESAVWVSERKDLLCAFFFLAACLLYLRHASRTGPSAKAYAAALGLFALALLSKPMAVSLPLVLILLDLYPLDR
ncbi:MAG: hypothetical protein GWM98_18810, partial [Nitrospinaceae bacterium]|nr:hypothetical protein [Nitrospinaceae bacterium]NIR56158.1 hypothetical protein [Nitrospinaceae bacterium]NIS86614.1 hypothetical protein [Nitrospinaceae bacterium]NIT83444.1 hypothetical protein [Nitrospinaceae bacterium]NIU45652.1 hypothetical protein [Nitrospinaceae bacterium]